MTVALFLFWGMLALVVVCVTIAGHLGRLETEKTIRQAIERGAALDVETIAELKRAASMPWALRLAAFGVVIVFVAVGLAVFALVLGASEPESVTPLLAIAGFVMAVGAGLLACALLLRRAWKTEGR